jgi:hypothetical protein
MANQHVYERLVGLQATLNGVHHGSGSLSASSRGNEREKFISSYLQRVLPSTFRFGTGDATDVSGNRSGQLDVVVEYPIAPTLPSPTSGDTRLYLAESVAAVVEVKSNVAGQWDEVERTAKQLALLRREYSSLAFFGSEPSERIPLFAAGYTGWKTEAPIRRQLEENNNIAGILVIDTGLFFSSQEYGGWKATGPWSLWGLICALHRITNSLQSASTEPEKYGD